MNENENHNEKIIRIPEKSNKVFSDEGRYEVIDDGSGEIHSGKYSIDTRIINEVGSDYNEWETLIRVQPDDQPTSSEDDADYELPAVYRTEGEVIRLWESNEDVNGELAEKFHKALVVAVKKGLSPELIVEAAFVLVKKLSTS